MNSSPFMGRGRPISRLRSPQLLPVHGEVAPKAPEGPPPIGRLRSPQLLPIHGEGPAPSAGCAGHFPASGEELLVAADNFSIFMGRGRRHRPAAPATSPQAGKSYWSPEITPPHSWGGGAEGAGGPPPSPQAGKSY
jgi:hypothetical protein